MSYADTNIINKMGFTELEVSFLTAFINGLYAEPHFSDQDVKDVAKGMGVAIPSAKGVLGSLVKKGIVNTQDSGTGYDLIYLNPEYFYLHTSWREDSYEPCPIPEHLRDTPAPAETPKPRARHYTILTESNYPEDRAVEIVPAAIWEAAIQSDAMRAGEHDVYYSGDTEGDVQFIFTVLKKTY